MSRDFTLVLVCEASALAELFESVEEHLLDFDLTRSREVFVSNHENDVDFKEEEPLIVNNITDDKTTLFGWQSIYMGFRSLDISFGLDFNLIPGGLTEGCLFINMKKMYQLHKGEIPAKFYEVIGCIAVIARTVGGFAAFEAELMEPPPEQRLSQLLANPGDRQLWCDIHVVKASRLAYTSAESAWIADFERTEARGYVFFISREFLEICREFG
jgi:hypothetical protein